MGGEAAEKGGRKRTNGERGAVNKGDVHTGILARLRTRIVDRSLASSLVACARRPTHDGGSTTSPLAGLSRVEVTGGGDMWLRTLASSRPVSDGFRVSIPVSAPYMPHLRGLVFSTLMEREFQTSGSGTIVFRHFRRLRPLLLRLFCVHVTRYSGPVLTIVRVCDIEGRCY